ncbi:hypothetical protein CDL60_08970 [Roseateles noduli]|nr:hypothetical protein CDL60_08970 [Roseateles noduli]
MLELRLGGANGVVEAFLAAGGQDYGVIASACTASDRWCDAELAVSDAANVEFPALVLRLAGEDLDEALAEELVTIELADRASAAGAETERLPL